MRTMRTPETTEDKIQRLKQEARCKSDDRTSAEAAVDEMIRRNVEVYGP